MTDISEDITSHRTVDALIQLLRERLTNSVNSEIASFHGAFASLTDVVSVTRVLFFPICRIARSFHPFFLSDLRNRTNKNWLATQYTRCN